MEHTPSDRRRKARSLVRAVAALVIVTLPAIYFEVFGAFAAFMTLFWMALIFGPALAWPLTAGWLTGRLVNGAALLSLVLLVFSSGQASDPSILFVLGWSGLTLLLGVIGALISFPRWFVSRFEQLARV